MFVWFFLQREKTHLWWKSIVNMRLVYFNTNTNTTTNNNIIIIVLLLQYFYCDYYSCCKNLQSDA